jgi:prepilin-type N-terminal cleavage/methylation domain-containing protein
MRARSHSGFTLIELSIVLVIIGLLVGGVLVGRDLIKGAEIRSAVSQLEKFAAATNTFKLKYNCLPGDCAKASTFGLGTAGGVGTDGNGNGIVLSYRYFDINNLSWAERTEIYNFWHHLGRAGLTVEYTGVAPDNAAAPSNLSGYMPKLTVGSSPTFAVAAHADDSNTHEMFGAAFIITAFESPNATLPVPCCNFAHTLTAHDAWSIDAKLDDGMPMTGTVRAIYPNVGPYFSAGPGYGCDWGGYDILGTRTPAGTADSPARPDRIDCGLVVKSAW